MFLKLSHLLSFSGVALSCILLPSATLAQDTSVPPPPATTVGKNDGSVVAGAADGDSMTSTTGDSAVPTLFAPTDGFDFDFDTKEAQSFDECIIQSIFSGFGEMAFDQTVPLESGGNSDNNNAAPPSATTGDGFDPMVECCTKFPDSPTCAFNDCFGKLTGMLTCECSVVSDLVTDMAMAAGPLMPVGVTSDPGVSVESSTGGDVDNVVDMGTRRELAVADCCKDGMAMDEFQNCMGDFFPVGTGSDGGFDFGSGGPEEGFGFGSGADGEIVVRPPTSAQICPEENEALTNCLTTEEDPYGFQSFGCSLCETTAQLQDFMGYYTCDGKKENGFCGDYANCVKEQCNADCMDRAFDLINCNSVNAEDELCGLQCSIEDATNTTSNSTAPQSFEECYAEALVGGLLGGIYDAPDTDTIVTSVGPGEACCVDFPDAPVCSPQSFGDCMLQSVYGLTEDNIFDVAEDNIFADPAANSPSDFVDPTVACCADFPGAPMCALNGCFDESTDMITCECSVVVDLLINLEATEFGLTMGAPEEGTAAAAAECCQEGVSNNEFQMCMEEMFPDETDDGDMLSGGEGITFEDGNASTAISSTTDAIKDENSTPSTEAPPAATTEAPDTDFLTSSASNTKDMVAVFISAVVVGVMQML
mmetsp:Transcript_26916/g.48560  ORF Transcript_26916/g.48560 Transcript_26916/m.48560 type:complete len:647 (-) Transcript_26916:204-2144(-)